MTDLVQTSRDRSVLPGGTINDFPLPPSHDLVIERGEGTHVWDTSGRRLHDFLLGSGPLVLGHAHPAVVDAVCTQVARGSTYYLPNLPVVDLAEEICALVPSAEQVRFCSDGSEAVFYALRIARAYTGRDLVVKFEGGFHGHTDYALQSFAPRDSLPFPRPTPDTAGIPAATSATVLVTPFNDLSAFDALMAEVGDRVAAVVVEPVQRAIEPEEGFLAGLREVTRRHGSLLVFDEVVTGFRLHLGGAQSLYGVTPDLTTLGKSMSGGLAIAAVAGPAEIMRIAAGTGGDRGIYMSGTLNGNPLSAAAGLATLRTLQEIDGCEAMMRRGAMLRSGLRDAVERAGVEACVIGAAPFPEVVFGRTSVRDYGDYRDSDRGAAMTFGLGLLDEGFLVRPGTKIYVSAVHTDEQVQQLLEAAGRVLERLHRTGTPPGTESAARGVTN